MFRKARDGYLLPYITLHSDFGHLDTVAGMSPLNGVLKCQKEQQIGERLFARAFALREAFTLPGEPPTRRDAAAKARVTLSKHSAEFEWANNF